MKQTRIVLAGMPKLMIDIVGSLLADVPGLHLVARLQPGEDILKAIRRHRADIVIVGTAEDPSAHGDLFLCRPAAVLEIADRGQSGTVWVLRPQARSVGELSAERMTQAIRLAMGG